MASHIYYELNNGMRIPGIALGTWKSAPELVGGAVKFAIDSGYRHIDCAYDYKNEKDIGKALKELIEKGVVSRNDVFVTSKLDQTFHRPSDVFPGFETSLKDLGLDYLDLFLMHWPVAFKNRGDGEKALDENGNVIVEEVPLEDTWREMETLVDRGLTRSIGTILRSCRIRPVVNQVELHPYLPQHELLEFCKNENIQVAAYSPLGGSRDPNLLKDPLVVSLAKKYEKTGGQVLLSWGLQRSTQVIAKSVHEDRIKSNIQTFTLDNEDFEVFIF
ncbi:aldo-keto reductase [Chytridium lagenaria]|nr:aldo-keto reductase [Chytridium lagenaria]